MTDSLNLLTDLLKNARKAGVTAADALLYSSSSLSASRRMRKPEGLERSESTGVGLRVFVGDRSAAVSSSDTGKEACAELITRAVAMAKLAPEDPYATLAPEELLVREIRDLDLYDDEEPPVEWLQEQCEKAEDIALGTPGITNSEGADASFGKVQYALAASNGFTGSYRNSRFGISAAVLAGEGTQMERDYDVSSAHHLEDLKTPEEVGKEAARRTLKRMGARKITTCKVPVVFEPRISRGMLGILAGAINGASIARGTSFLKNEMGKEIFTPGITIIDEPHRKRGLGSHPFDGEGVRGKKMALVENGVLQSWLLDMRTANKLKLTTTGHAARGLSGPPSPSTSNLYMQAGEMSPEELIADIKQGFYVTEVFGMGVNIVTGDYSQGASGLWIENGQIAYPVSEITIAGKLQDMFKRLTPANDLEFRYGVNAPTLRIEGMTVAGK